MPQRVIPAVMWAVFTTEDEVHTCQHAAFTSGFELANDLFGMYALLRLSPIVATAPSTQLIKASSGVWNVIEISVSVIKFGNRDVKIMVLTT